jgi:ABC-2 type transport system permease protein
MIIATSGLMTLPSRMAWYRESGVLRRLKATPLHPQAILAAHVMTIFLINLLGMALLIIAAKVVFDLQLAQILPLTHVVTLLRGLWASEGWGAYYINVAILSIWLVVGVIVSAKTFRWE